MTGYMNDLDIKRFVAAQELPHDNYEQALQEIREGRKRTHWIWYIFPQLRGLGGSYNANYYGIADREEAALYLQHPVLGARLREITHALLQHRGTPIVHILGSIDALKVCSCMTLFDAISPDDVFGEVLSAFYSDNRCELTMRMYAPPGGES